jgi:glycosyltransferase involved in cell wall biosynthesis
MAPDPRPAPAELLHILFMTSDAFPPFRPAAKAIFSEGIAELGHRIDWLLPAQHADGPHGEQPFRGGTAFVAATNERGTRLGRLLKHWACIRNDLRVFGLLRRRRYSLVQIKDKYLGALFAIAAARLARVPIFYWLAYPHGEASLYAAEQGVARYRLIYRLRGAMQRWLLYRVIMPSCAHVFVQSEQMRLDVAAEGVPLERTTAVPSSLNLDEVEATALRPPPALATDARSIVYLGTLLRERQLDFLVRVLALVVREVPDANLVFVGRGEMPEDEQLLRAEAERLGVAERVQITGWLPMPLAWEHVRRAGVCVSPYFPAPILRSTSPTKLVEYFALGKAVVANDHPEQTAVIDRSGGGIVCPWDEHAFAAGIVRLLRDPRLAAELGEAGRRYVAAHRTHWAMVDLVLTHYRDALARSRGTQPTPLARRCADQR